MAKKKSVPSGLDPVAEKLLVHAAGQAAYVLRPFPKEIPGEDVERAIAAMREDGLVHGSRREPNLTVEGIELAQSLVAA